MIDYFPIRMPGKAIRPWKELSAAVQDLCRRYWVRSLKLAQCKVFMLFRKAMVDRYCAAFSRARSLRCFGSFTLFREHFRVFIEETSGPEPCRILRLVIPHYHPSKCETSHMHDLPSNLA